MNIAALTLCLLCSHGPAFHHRRAEFQIAAEHRTTREIPARSEKANWRFRLRRANVMVCWTAVPFRRTGPVSAGIEPRGKNRYRNLAHFADASLKLRIAKQSDKVRTKILKEHDTTGLEIKKRTATVCTAISGSGRGEVELRISLNDKLAPAGTYTTTVFTTVTSN